MRFFIKIFICTVLMVALSFATGGYLLIGSNFAAAKNREISRALDEHLSVQYMLESAIISEGLQGLAEPGEVLSSAAQETAKSIRQGSQSNRSILVYDSNNTEIYPSQGEKVQKQSDIAALAPGQVVYRIAHTGAAYALEVTGGLTYNSALVYLCYIADISDVFKQREAQIHTFIVYQGIIILVSFAVVFGLSWFLTHPIRKLTQVSNKIAGGELGQRAEIRSTDEIGVLAKSFNIMATSLEDKIQELEKSSRAKDDFIANFTHELKTPMTSIIGYSDILRSKEMEPAESIMAATYIYREASRLEALSIKLLDLVMLEQTDFVFSSVSCPALLEYILKVALPSFERDGVRLTVSAQDGIVLAESDLIKTLLINLTDNARKATASGGLVELVGCHSDGGRYTFTVRDHGHGIPPEELEKITEAFYMVDKARSRAQHGAGLGLAIASRIATLHDTALNIQSTVGVGTMVSISLPCCPAEEDEKDENE